MLRTLVLAQKDEWRALIDALPPDRRDIHFEPDLLSIYEEVYGWPVRLAYYGFGNGEFIIQPCVIDTTQNQLRHAYNFGGPISTPGCGLEQYSIFHQKVQEFKQTVGVKSEYCSFNPMLFPQQTDLIGGGADIYVKDVVWMDVNNIQLRATTRHMVEKSLKLGVRAEAVTVDKTSLQCFNAIYQETMNRRSAAEHWKFPRKYFEAHELIKDHVGLIFVKVNDQVESACMLIHGHGTAYYHYAGWLGNHHNIGVNHLMVLSAAMFSRDKLGCKRLHLGGGTSAEPNEGLFVFKSGFSPYRAPLHVYKVDTHVPTENRVHR